MGHRRAVRQTRRLRGHLIAHALADPANRRVVTTETSKPSASPQNRRIPDACGRVGVTCMHTFQMLRQLSFSTRWQP
ncbi:DUF4411 family protein [Geminicoccus flavidas]|uniref:DUF4411 family protein n=1 Tax=Geminicoccus flavidas TaxID=2506407 RepID=UPI001358E8E4